MGKISKQDKVLVAKLQSEILNLELQAKTLQMFVTQYLTSTYKLNPGDRIEDNGEITRNDTSIQE